MEQITFASDSLMISADLYLPEHADGNNIPIIVQGGGWCYVKEIVQPSFAKEFNDRGMAALVFDYRYLGGSRRRATAENQSLGPDRGLQERHLIRSTDRRHRF